MKRIQVLPLPDLEFGVEFRIELPSGAQLLQFLGGIRQNAPMLALPSRPGGPQLLEERVAFLVRFLAEPTAISVAYRLVVVVDGMEIPASECERVHYVDSLNIPRSPLLHLLEIR